MLVVKSHVYQQSHSLKMGLPEVLTRNKYLNEDPPNSYFSSGQPETASKYVLIDLIKQPVIDLNFAIA